MNCSFDDGNSKKYVPYINDYKCIQSICIYIYAYIRSESIARMCLFFKDVAMLHSMLHVFNESLDLCT